MIVLHRHLLSCREDRNLLYTTLGLGFWSLLSLASLAVSGIVVLWPH